jgi:hypothetical protein
MMEVLTPPIGKTSTCLTLPSPALTTFCRLDELGLEAVGQRLEPDRSWPVGSPSPMIGAGGVGAKGRRGTRSRAGWRTSRSGGAPRCCWSRSAASGVLSSHDPPASRAGPATPHGGDQGSAEEA